MLTGVAWARIADGPGTVGAVVALSLFLNLFANNWGAPERWHPDEIISEAVTIVRDGDPSPHFFAYGMLPYYVVAASVVVVPTLLEIADPEPPQTTAAHSDWARRHETRVIRTARMVSAVAAALVALVTYLLGRRLFGPRTGLLAALLLAVSPGLVTVGHYATVDSSATLAYWVACLLALRVWDDPRRRWYLLAGFASGVAIGIKADRAVVVLPLLLAHLFHESPRRHSYLAAAAVPLGFVCANPILLVTPFEFADGYVRELLFNVMRDAPGENSYVVALGHLRNSVGVPMFVVSLATSAVACWTLARSRHRQLAWLLATVVPYFAVTAGRTFYEWYAPFLLPAVLLLTAFGSLTLAAGPRPWAPVVVILALAAGTAGTTLRTTSLIRQYIDETRHHAARWLETHARTGAAIAVPYYPPLIDGRTYRVLSLPQERGVRHEQLVWRDRLDANEPYVAFRSALVTARARVTGHESREPPYTAWFDHMAANVARDAADGDATVDGADYLVIYPNVNPELLARVRAEGSGFVEVARFEPPPPSLVEARTEFVSPTILVFERRAGRHAAPPPSAADVRPSPEGDDRRLQARAGT